MSIPPDDDGYKVGPGNPPREHRWKKGEPSPNPRGRPAKKPQEKLLVQMNPLHNAVLAHTAKEITLRTGDGERTITQLEAFLDMLLKQVAKNNPKAIQTYYAAVREATAEAASYKTEMLSYALQHRERWLQQFIEADERGKPLPDIFPDPRDVEILSDGTVNIVGPLNIQQRRAVPNILQQLDNYHSVWSDVKNNPNLSLEDQKQIWSKTTRAMRKLNSGLPPRLKRTLPLQPEQ